MHIKTNGRLYSFTLEYLGIGAVIGAIKTHMPPHKATSLVLPAATNALKCLVSGSDSDVEALVRHDGVSAVLDAYFEKRYSPVTLKVLLYLITL